MRRTLVFLVLLLVVAGCGAKQGGDLKSVDNAMAKAGTSRVEMKLVNEGKLAITAEGTFDYEHKRGHMVLRPADPRYDGSFPYEGLFIGRATYSGWTLLGKKRWHKESDQDASGPESIIPGPGGPSPDRALARILESSKRVETLGEDEIRGVRTKHYRVHLDPGKLGDEYEGYPPEFEQIIHVWVDSEGLLRRLRISIEGDAPEYTLDFFDYGVAVDIEPPSDDELVTQSELDELIAAECKLRKERGEPWDESECTREGVVEGNVEEVPMETVIEP